MLTDVSLLSIELLVTHLKPKRDVEDTENRRFVGSSPQCRFQAIPALPRPEPEHDQTSSKSTFGRILSDIERHSLSRLSSAPVSLNEPAIDLPLENPTRVKFNLGVDATSFVSTRRISHVLVLGFIKVGKQPAGKRGSYIDTRLTGFARSPPQNLMVSEFCSR